MRFRKLLQRREQLIADARAIAERYPDGPITGEDRDRYDALLKESDDLKADIDREARAIEQEKEQAEAARKAADLDPAGSTDPNADHDADKGTPDERLKHFQAVRATEFRKFLRADRSGTYKARAVAVDAKGQEVEARDVTGGEDQLGGYLMGPETFVAELIQAVDDAVLIRQRARKFQLATGHSMGAPSLDTDPDDADWTHELGTGSEDDAMRFGKRELNPHPLAKRMKLSKTLLRRAVMNAEGIARARLAYKFAVTQENAFLTGNGAQRPLGVFTASSDGISTGRDVSTGNTSTEIRFDGLIEAKFTLKSQYWTRAEWIYHRDALKQISKLKDGEGQYLWQPSRQAGQPDMLLGLPYRSSEFAPNTFTASQYVGILGDFSHYWIADALDMEFQTLVELYAETNQIGIIGRLETDGMPVLEEAFVRVKLSA
jgi:HK97 family phage major capsid protein